MPRHSKSFIAILLLLGAASLISWNSYFQDLNLQQNDKANINYFPRQIGGWVSQDLPFPKNDFAGIGENNAFIREYKNSKGNAVELYVVYSQTNRKASYPPELFYSTKNISVIENTPGLLSIDHKKMAIPVKRLFLETENGQQVSFYWFKVGDAFTASYYKQQILAAFNTMLGKKKGSALIRISADVVNHDKQAAIEEIKEFADLFVLELPKYLP